MSPALVKLISIPRRFLPHRALFPLPHPSAQPWAQPGCNYSLITHTHTYTLTLSLMFCKYTFSVWILQHSLNWKFCFFVDWMMSSFFTGGFHLFKSSKNQILLFINSTSINPAFPGPVSKDAVSSSALRWVNVCAVQFNLFATACHCCLPTFFVHRYSVRLIALCDFFCAFWLFAFFSLLIKHLKSLPYKLKQVHL